MNEPNPLTITVRQLPEWLLHHVPALTDAYTAEMVDRLWDEYPNAYFVLSCVLEPHLLELLDAGDEQEVQRMFNLLEYLAQHGDASVQNELWITMEELDVWQVWRYLGPKLRKGEQERLTILMVDSVANAHVDREHYQRRWEEEIEKIGGWDHLTASHHMWIRHGLRKEFRIVHVLPPMPGSADGRSRRLL